MKIAQQWDALIVGAGLAGLTAGAYITVAGKRVLVLEYGDVVGGSTHVFRRRGQWEFDVGIHHLGNCGPDGLLPALFRGLGLQDRVEFLPMGPDCIEVHRFPGLESRVPIGLENFEAHLIATFPADTRGIRRFMRVMRGIGSALDLGKTPASAVGLASFALRAKHHAPWTLMPLQRLFAFCELSPEAQLALSMESFLYMAPPSRAPVGMHAAFLWAFVERGPYYPRGGGQMLSAHLADVIRTHGSEVRTKAQVSRILVDGGRVTGVELQNGETVLAPVVVSTADLKKTVFELVGPQHFRPRKVRRVREGRMCLPWFNAYIGLDVDLKDRIPNTDYFSFPTWDSFEDVWTMLSRRGTRTDSWLDDLARRLPAYIHTSNVKDPDNPRYAPPGHTALEVMAPITGDHAAWGLSQPPGTHDDYRRNSQYLELKEHLTDVMVQRLEEAIPGTKEHVVFREAGTPITQERYTLPTEGSAYGLELSTDQFAQFGRYGVRTEIPGLFLAGASCTWGPGVEGVMHSGVYAASAVVGRDLAAEVRSGAVLATPSRLSVITPDWDPLQASRRPSHRDHGRGRADAEATF